MARHTTEMIVTRHKRVKQHQGVAPPVPTRLLDSRVLGFLASSQVTCTPTAASPRLATPLLVETLVDMLATIGVLGLLATRHLAAPPKIPNYAGSSAVMRLGIGQI